MSDEPAATPVARFHVQQKITPFANRYRVYADADGRPGPLVGFVRQKRLALRERFQVYADEGQREPVLEVHADRVVDVRSHFSVDDPRSGEHVGVLAKVGMRSLLRSTWHVEQPGRPPVTVSERSLAVALLRRLWGLVPYLGEVPVPWVFHFDGTDPDGRLVLRHTRRWGLRDRYVLEVFSPDLDVRLAIALGVCLDAMQSR